MDILSLNILVNEGRRWDKVWLLEIDIKIGDSPWASPNKCSPYYQNCNDTWLWSDSDWKLFIKEFLSSVGVFLGWDWVRLFSLIRIRFLLLSQALSFTANNGRLWTAACSTAVSFFLSLSSKFPNHESRENSDACEEKCYDAKPAEEAEAWKSVNWRGATQEESCSVGEWSNGDWSSGMDHALLHSLLDWVSRISLIDRGWDDKHIINSNTDEHERQEVMNSSGFSSDQVSNAWWWCETQSNTQQSNASGSWSEVDWRTGPHENDAVNWHESYSLPNHRKIWLQIRRESFLQSPSWEHISIDEATFLVEFDSFFLEFKLIQTDVVRSEVTFLVRHAHWYSLRLFNIVRSGGGILFYELWGCSSEYWVHLNDVTRSSVESTLTRLNFRDESSVIWNQWEIHSILLIGNKGQSWFASETLFLTWRSDLDANTVPSDITLVIWWRKLYLLQIFIKRVHFFESFYRNDVVLSDRVVHFEKQSDEASFRWEHLLLPLAGDHRWVVFRGPDLWFIWKSCSLGHTSTEHDEHEQGYPKNFVRVVGKNGSPSSEPAGKDCLNFLLNGRRAFNLFCLFFGHNLIVLFYIWLNKDKFSI